MDFVRSSIYSVIFHAAKDEEKKSLRAFTLSAGTNAISVFELVFWQENATLISPESHRGGVVGAIDPVLVFRG